LSVKLPAFVEPTIQYDDILSVSINTLDLQSSTAMNMAPNIGAAASAIGSASSLSIPANSSYRVDKSGFIEIPLLGKFNVIGLTTQSLKNNIQNKLSEFYKMPSVDVKYLNFKVTVLGEVLKPGTYVIANEKITVLDALGLAGDLTIFGRRENVLLIRDNKEGESKQLVRINLNSKDLFTSPFFYLKQNDVLYIEPMDAKIANLDAVQNRYITIFSSVLSVLIILATRLR
jgi:polysaccharide export outer membrane protein